MKNELNTMIMQAMKEHNLSRTEVLRAIKAEFLKWQTAKENAGKEMTEADEIQVLKKMVKQRQESMEQYTSAGRTDLANAESYEIMVLKEFLPKEATPEQIVAALVEICNSEHIACDKRNMGVLVKKIKEKLPGADGKMVAQTVQKNLV